MNPKINKRRAISKQSLYESPMAIMKKIAYNGSHVILNRTESGYYSYTVFWKDPEEIYAEPLVQAVKPYKLKTKCIASIKKLFDALPHFGDYTIPTFDPTGTRINTKIEYKKIF